MIIEGDISSMQIRRKSQDRLAMVKHGTSHENSQDLLAMVKHGTKITMGSV